MPAAASVPSTSARRSFGASAPAAGPVKGPPAEEAVQVLRQRVRRRVSPPGLLIETDQANRRQVAGDAPRPKAMRRNRLRRFDLSQRLNGRSPPKRRPARKQFVEDDAQ